MWHSRCKDAKPNAKCHHSDGFISISKIIFSLIIRRAPTKCLKIIFKNKFQPKNALKYTYHRSLILCSNVALSGPNHMPKFQNLTFFFFSKFISDCVKNCNTENDGPWSSRIHPRMAPVTENRRKRAPFLFKLLQNNLSLLNK